MVVAADGLDDAGLVDLLGEFDDFERRVWSEGGGLDDNGIACEEGWDDLADAKDDWEVPRIVQSA